MTLCPIAITQELVRIQSVTPDSSVCLDVVEKYMKSIGAKIVRKTFSQEGTYDVDNIYARIGTGSPHIMLTGHVDVVPIGETSLWTQDPWGGDIVDGKLYGRGSADMKSGVASSIVAMTNVYNDPSFTGSVSILITGDEEAKAINGTEKVLKYVSDMGESWDCALTLEATNFGTMADQIKVGRRGSLTAKVIAHGKQGHVGYPERVDNALHSMSRLMNAIVDIPMDNGNQFFDPSSVQIVHVNGGTGATNIAPGTADFTFNIRFSSQFTGDSLTALINETLDATGRKYTLEIDRINRSFVTDPADNPLADQLADVIDSVVGSRPAYVTNGGTSDSRFITNYCPVVDYGVNGSTIHQVDECVSVSDIEQLEKIVTMYLKTKVC